MRHLGETSEQSLNRTINRILLGIVVVVCLVLLVLWRTDSPRIERMRMSLADRFVPSMSWVSEPIDIASEMFRDYENFATVYEQNRTLRREIQRLQAWRETARQLEEENAQLRALNNVRLAPRTTFVTGDIITDSGGPFLQSVLVNVGARDGVRDGSAAVDGKGVVGRVVGVGRRAARILLLTDFSSRVPVVVLPSGTRGILTGDGTQTPVLQFLDNADQVKPGDQIETSGDGGVFPPNLPVGRLIATGNPRWRVILAADYSRLEFVRLLRYSPDTRIDGTGGLILDRLEQSSSSELAPVTNSGSE
ncbi:rod shape-determining protein MreC [Rhodobacteraceae bacterium NNCM2]|nr:rod shape-determining protein MreC [Coraliihabitans acroporae]